MNGAWSGPIGGTSLSCPIFSALQTDINPKQKSRNGFVNTRICNVFTATGYADFHDVTSGSNGAFSAHSGFSASPIGQSYHHPSLKDYPYEKRTYERPSTDVTQFRPSALM
jgi:kumamolisin